MSLRSKHVQCSCGKLVDVPDAGRAERLAQELTAERAAWHGLRVDLYCQIALLTKQRDRARRAVHRLLKLKNPR